MKVAVTGCSSDFATVILPRLIADEDVEEIVGIDIRAPRVEDPKLRFVEQDVRSEKIGGLFEGADAVIHLAYVVSEIADKELTHDVNINGSRNVLEAAAGAGVRRLVMASSVASYGMHGDHPDPVTEDEFPRGNPDKYYFYDKAEVEHFVEWWLARNPDTDMTVTRLRPVIIVGPSFTGGMLENTTRPVSVLPKSDVRVQLLHEDDLADAFCRCAKDDHPGAFNVGPVDVMDAGELGVMHGQKVARLPARPLARIADLAFKVGLSPASSDWVVDGELRVDSSRLSQETGWAPQFTSREAAVIHLLQRGRPIVASGGELHRREVAEAALAPLTKRLRGWCDTNRGLREAVGGAGAFDELIEGAEHVYLPFRTGEVHAEVHPADDPSAPSIVFTPGLGGHARFYSPALGCLRRAGFNVIGWDRPGHGLSEGRRGDATVPETLDALEAVIRLARSRFSGPVVMGGSSLGGVLTWLALTAELDVDAAFSHNIARGDMPHEPAAARKAPLLKAFARAFPRAPVPITQIADFGAAADDAESLRFFTERQDGLWAWSITARSAASLNEWRAPRDWAQVSTPTLVLQGAGDVMVGTGYVSSVFEASHPAGARLDQVPGAGHLLFHDHLPDALERVEAFVGDWAGAAAPAQTVRSP
ncbi:MAG: alpha/beta fold hydrolase [Thermoleophilaceae bacterium]|nr:alpha/beta fold hydrolase [Thermoleophilaceae bacterium]